ncbi:hypothetical protein B7463_g12097, partial [Scytalidium lignicola]
MIHTDLDNGFDYIVVGGGTAGLVVASRLSEDAGVSVLVVEAGGDHQGDPAVQIPGLSAKTLGKEQYDWNFTTVPQAALNNRRIRQPRGKGLGGSSAINFLMTVFPSRGIIDAWGKLGNEGWSYDELAPYFLKFGTRHSPSEEVCQITRTDVIDNHLSGHGPIHMSYGNGFGPMNSAWMDVHTQLGLKPTGGDLASGQVSGAFQNTFNIDPATKTRSYAATAYYGSEARQRSNLTVLTNTIVQKIELQDQDSEVVATGVQVRMKDGSVRYIQARTEVILGAGALQSPQLLELSGIGGRALLEQHGINVVVENPNVGENLQDHVQVCHSWQCKESIPSRDMFRDPNILQAGISQYEDNNGDGPLGRLSISSSYLPMVDIQGRISEQDKKALLDKYARDATGGNLLVKELLTQSDHPAVAYIFSSGQRNVKDDPADYTEYITPTEPENYMSILNILSHPFSRGSCHIASPDVDVAPILDPRYFSHPADIEIMARSAMFVEKLASTEPFRSTVFQPRGRRLPDGIVPNDLDCAREFVRRQTISIMHLSATCSMLPREQGGVVDSRLLVYGTRNLRVVDASIFPLEPLGNIQTTVYAVAEKAADMIRQDRSMIYRQNKL